MENVPQVLTAPEWPTLVERLEGMGYRNRWAKLDSSNFGSAQKRVRAFMVSRLGKEPPELPLSAPNAPRLCLRDVMEPTRDERFIQRIPLDRIKWRNPPEGYRHPQSAGLDCPLMDASDPRLETRRIASERGLCPTLRTGCPQKAVEEEEEEERVKPLVGKADSLRMAPKGRKAIVTAKDGIERMGRIYSPDGRMPTLDQLGRRGNRMIKVAASWDRPKRYRMANDLLDPDGMATTLVNHGGGDRDVKVVAEDTAKAYRSAAKILSSSSSSSSPTLRSQVHGVQNQPGVEGGESQGFLTVNKLTPRECWRLMGQPEWAFMRASRVCSETQLYNQAGNSIVVEVLMAIFSSMLGTRQPEKAQSRLESFGEAGT